MNPVISYAPYLNENKIMHIIIIIKTHLCFYNL